MKRGRTPDLTTDCTPQSSLRTWPFSPWPERRVLLSASLVIHILGLALPLALLQVYDRILPRQAHGTLVVLGLGVAAAIVLEAVLRHGRAMLFARMGARMELQAQRGILDRLALADRSEIERIGVAQWVQGHRALAQLRDIWSGSAGVTWYEMPFVLLYLGLVAYVGAWLVLIPLVLLGVALLTSWWGVGDLERSIGAVERADHARRDFQWAAFAALDDLKSRGGEAALARHHAALQSNYLAAAARLDQLNGRLRENMGLFSQLATVLIVMAGAHQVVSGALTTGALSACTLLAGRSIGPAMQAFGLLARWAQARQAQAQLDELMAVPLAPGSSLDAAAGAVPAQGALEVVRGEQVWSIRPGEIVEVRCRDLAFASAWMGAVAGLQHAPGMTVQLDGRELGSCGVEHIREAICFVPRLPALIPGTILDNLTLFDSRLELPAQVVSEALGLDGMLSRHPHGLLTLIGDLGTQLPDEGLFQRIALVRALVRQPKVLLLNHAGSGLDLDGQQRLAQWLASRRGASTVLMLTAKAPLQAVCDRHIELEAA